MTTSGTTSFSLPLDELLEQASLRVGGEAILGTEARTSRRALNLLFTDLQNRGVLLHTLDQVLTTVATSVAIVTCSSDTLDIMDLVVRRSGTDLAATRISFDDYNAIPVKTQSGRPTQYFVNRQRDNVLIYLWPQPENSTDVLVYWKVRFIQDAGALANDPDFPRRFWPSLVSGLAYYLALQRGMKFPLDRLALLKGMFEEDLANVLSEDSERVSFFAVPKFSR